MNCLSGSVVSIPTMSDTLSVCRGKVGRPGILVSLTLDGDKLVCRATITSGFDPALPSGHATELSRDYEVLIPFANASLLVGYISITHPLA